MWLVSRATRLTFQFSMSVVTCGEDGCEPYKLHQRGAAFGHTLFVGTKLCREHKFISVFGLSMGIKFSLVDCVD